MLDPSFEQSINQKVLEDAPVRYYCQAEIDIFVQGRSLMSKDAPSKLTLQDLSIAADRLKNWGRWGPDDEIGTLNNISPQDIVNAARLIRKGKVFSLALNFDSNGPQSGLWGNRFNPIHTMITSGVDAIAGRQEEIGVRYADDIVTMPLQCGTQWDALGHIFFGNKMWNGYDARLVDSNGAHKNGIEKVKDKMVGRGVLLDIPRFKKVEFLDDGYGISSDEIEKCASVQKVEVRKGDFVIVRTGHMERCLRSGKWGDYAGGDAPGLKFETADWIHRTDIAAICADTWGCEVRPNGAEAGISQPWHWIVIPMIGITMGEIFYLRDLANDCAQDGIYDFFFCAPPLPITRAVGSPINPMAIK
jgi:kynurenine formamidase